MPNHVANPLSNEIAKMRDAVTYENNRADQAANLPKLKQWISVGPWPEKMTVQTT
jgi:hypothetical protein